MENKINTKHYKIPQDILMDILRILFGNKIKHRIEGIKERENVILIVVQYNENKTRSEQAQDNIEGILRDYSDYMKGLLGDSTLFMDEEESED